MAALLLPIYFLRGPADDHLSDHPDLRQSWDELCASMDCSELPKGYSTWSIGGERYYFPLYQALKVVPESLNPATFSPEFGPFMELDAGGKVVRSFGHAPATHTTAFCCNWLLFQTDLANLY